MIEVKPIRTESEYATALQRIDLLMDAEPGTPQGDELDVLVTLVESYEKKHQAIGDPDPVEYLKNTMEFFGIGQSELAEVLNSRSRASEILNRKRPLTLDQIRRITSRWQIPADPLIAEYELTG